MSQMYVKSACIPKYSQYLNVPYLTYSIYYLYVVHTLYVLTFWDLSADRHYSLLGQSCSITYSTKSRCDPFALVPSTVPEIPILRVFTRRATLGNLCIVGIHATRSIYKACTQLMKL